MTYFGDTWKKKNLNGGYGKYESLHASCTGDSFCIDLRLGYPYSYKMFIIDVLGVVA